jgi:uncharacterized circularly permuted ATP-grasp superfamily protein
MVNAYSGKTEKLRQITITLCRHSMYGTKAMQEVDSLIVTRLHSSGHGRIGEKGSTLMPHDSLLILTVNQTLRL